MANEVILQKDITDQVSNRIGELEKDGLKLPVNYNAANALKSAWFAIQKAKDKNNKPALDIVTKKSVANALLDMVVQGLTPAKTQCYFVVYGNELQLQRSYFGTQAVLKRLGNVRDIWAEVVHKDDIFKIGSEKGRTIVKEFDPDFSNQDKEIVGAFAVIEKIDGEKVYTVMTKKEIDQSWSKSKMRGSGPQKEFPQEMAKRTVINRAAKSFINTSDDSDLFVESVKRTTENEYDNDNERKDVTPQSERTQALEEKFFSSKESSHQVAPNEPATRVANIPGQPEIEQAHVVEPDAKYDERGRKVTTHEGYTGYIAPEIADYFKAEYAKSPVQVVPGHWPSMETKEDVDEWIKDINNIPDVFEKAIEDKKGSLLDQTTNTPDFSREEGQDYVEPDDGFPF